MIKAILFDLDGTLLPMDQDMFLRNYMMGLTKKLEQRGYEPQKLAKSIWLCTQAMVKNTGEATNETVFWESFQTIFGPKVRMDAPVLESFYRKEFQLVQSVCGFNPQAAEAITQIKAMGYRVILATNPLFPAIATHSRVRWAGLQPEDFEYITTYENSHHCKPNPEYYRDILNRRNLSPEECVMVGNDVAEDMIAKDLGMGVFLLTDCLINTKNTDISVYPRGSFPELMHFLSSR